MKYAILENKGKLSLFKNLCLSFSKNISFTLPVGYFLLRETVSLDGK
jgi:hypothetical protein